MPDPIPPYLLVKQWITAERIAAAEAARRVDYDRSNFHRLLKGRVKPTMELAHRIESVSNGAVPLSAWIGFEPLQQEAA